jgi:hypothetical protein
MYTTPTHQISIQFVENVFTGVLECLSETDECRYVCAEGCTSSGPNDGTRYSVEHYPDGVPYHVDSSGAVHGMIKVKCQMIESMRSYPPEQCYASSGSFPVTSPFEVYGKWTGAGYLWDINPLAPYVPE